MTGGVYASRLGLPLVAGLAIACVATGVGALLGGSGERLGGAVPLWLPVVCLGLLLAAVGVGVFWLPAGIFGRPLLRGRGARPEVALTFDDGPDPQDTRAVLDVLERHGARGTFFVIGRKAAQHPEVLAEMARRGHQVENHSYDHSYATPALPVRRLTEELLRTQQIIGAATGRAPRWFRPPVGLLSPRVEAAARAAGLLLCGYSGKGRDGLRGTTAAAAVARLGAALRPGAILVLHDAVERGADGRGSEAEPAARRPIAAAVLEELLPLLARSGLRAVTLTELLR